MQNRLSQPYCDFDSAEWEDETGIEVAIDLLSKTGSEARPCYYDQISGTNCDLHKDISQVTVREISNLILKHFQSSQFGPEVQRCHNTVLGVEVPGFDLQGRAFSADYGNEIDIICLIAHGAVNLSGSEVTSKFGLRSSLLEAKFEARGTTFAKNAVFTHSKFQRILVC
jgi:hypothetical protein